MAAELAREQGQTRYNSAIHGAAKYAASLLWNELTVVPHPGPSQVMIPWRTTSAPKCTVVGDAKLRLFKEKARADYSANFCGYWPREETYRRLLPTPTKENPKAAFAGKEICLRELNHEKQTPEVHLAQTRQNRRPPLRGAAAAGFRQRSGSRTVRPRIPFRRTASAWRQ